MDYFSYLSRLIFLKTDSPRINQLNDGIGFFKKKSHKGFFETINPYECFSSKAVFIDLCGELRQGEDPNPFALYAWQDFYCYLRPKDKTRDKVLYEF